MKKILYALIVLPALSCGSRKTPPAPVVTPERKISKINFFMETSGSMAGYLKGSTEFKNAIPNLLVEIKGKIDSGRIPLHNYYIHDSVMPFNGTAQQFISNISLNNPAKGKSSEMHNIFRMIADNTDSNDISLFVSDCILSYSDAEIRKDRYVNRDNAPGHLKSTITQAFLDLQKKNNICASLYGFNSAFHGKYYTYQNTPINLKGNIQRPYYIWAIGNRQLLINFNRQLKQLQEFKPGHISIDFGLVSDPIKDYNILFSYEKKGGWSTNYQSLEDVTASPKNKAAFALALNLSALPDHARDTAYLLSNLQKEGKNVNVNILRVAQVENIDQSKLRNKEKDILSNSTHVLLIEITDIHKPGNIQLRLPLNYDTSYRSVSIMDDSDTSKLAGKTFAFEHLVDGVRTAYQNHNQNFIQISIPVKK